MLRPNNFSIIKDILNENNIVFIVGDPEIGKTYTAIKLLLDHYKEGYDPIYVRDEREQFRIICEKDKLDGRAIYLEDPWGKTTFKAIEETFREIGNLAREVKMYNTRIIISSRTQVFEELNKNKETSEDLMKYKQELRVNLAYDAANLQEILKRYIYVLEPKWSGIFDLEQIAFSAAGSILRTPMSIRQFVNNTRNAEDATSIKEGLVKASEDTKIAFAREIKEMFGKGSYDSIVFLSLVYIQVNINYAMKYYTEIISELKKLGYDSIRAKDFSGLLEDFKDKEIGVAFDMLNFIHPSYEDAFIHSLTDDNKNPNVISVNLFSPILEKLSERPEKASRVAFILQEAFNFISPATRLKLLSKLSEINDPDVAFYTDCALAAGFHQIPQIELNTILYKFAKNEFSTARHIACITYLKADEIESDILGGILSNIYQRSNPMDHFTKIMAKSIFLHNMHKFALDDKEYLKDKFFDNKITPEIIDECKEVYDFIKVEIACIWPEKFSILKSAFPEKLICNLEKLESTQTTIPG